MANNLREEIEAMLELTQYDLRNRNAAGVQKINTEPSKVQVDCHLLRQFFLTLFTNVDDAMPRERCRTIRGRQVDCTAFIEVRNPGVGNSSEDMAHVLEAFFITKREMGGAAHLLPHRGRASR
jgi:C4-dicarboxylate-specific signal transduction histidine kinase